MVHGMEGGREMGRDIMNSSGRDSGIDPVIIKNFLIKLILIF